MRPEITTILSRRGTDIDHEFSQRVGIVGVRLNTDIPAGVMQAFELPADTWKETYKGNVEDFEKYHPSAQVVWIVPFITPLVMLMLPKDFFKEHEKKPPKIYYS